MVKKAQVHYAAADISWAYAFNKSSLSKDYEIPGSCLKNCTISEICVTAHIRIAITIIVPIILSAHPMFITPASLITSTGPDFD